MRLTIGDRYYRTHGENNGFIEVIIIDGLASMDDDLDDGEVVLPKGPDSRINVRMGNKMSSEWFDTTITLRRLSQQWEDTIR